MGFVNNHVNVYSTCLKILSDQGYKLSYDCDVDDEDMIIPDSQWWTAEKDTFSALANNPLELLGLARIYEYKLSKMKENVSELDKSYCYLP